MKENLTILVILFLGSLVGAYSITGQSFGPTEFQIEQHSYNDRIENHLNTNAFNDTSPIFASGNAGFDSVVSNLGLLGSGSENDPYIIEGYNISGFFSEAISLSSAITYHIVIRGNLLSNVGYNNILISNVANVTIESNTIIQPNIGIWVTSTSGHSIYNNTVIDSSSYGIYVSSANNFEIKMNSVENSNSYGIYSSSTNTFNIEMNTIVDSSSRGIYASSSNNYNIRNNNIIDSDSYGIQASGSGNVSPDNITNNVIVNAGSYGIYVNSDHNNTIALNQVSTSTYYAAIYLSTSANNSILDNTMVSGGIGFGVGDSAVGSLGNTMQTAVTGNTVFGKEVRFHQGQTNVIIDNDANVGQVILIDVDNSLVRDLTIDYADVGVAAYFSDSIQISGNSFMDAGRAAIELEESNNMNVFGNMITESHGGIRLVDVESVIVDDNTLIDVMYEAIRFTDINLTTVSNNVIFSSSGQKITREGIHGYDAYNSIFSGNFMNNLEDDAIQISYGDNNEFSGNFIYNVGEDGIDLDYMCDIIIANNRLARIAYDSLSLVEMDGGQVYDNTILNVGIRGLYLTGSLNFDVFDNLISGNPSYTLVEIMEYYDLLDQASNNITLTNNDFIVGNSEMVMYIDDMTAFMDGNYYSDYDGSGTYKADGSGNVVDLNPVSSPIQSEPVFRLSNSGSITYTVNASETHSITWTTNNELNVFNLYHNDQLVQTGNYVGSTVSYDVSGLPLGTHVFSLELTNYRGETVRSSAVVTVTPEDLPTVTSTVTETETITTTPTETENNDTGGGDDGFIGLNFAQTTIISSLGFVTLIIFRRRFK